MRAARLLALCAHALAAFAQATPDITVNRFHNLPGRLFYFEDSPVIIYHDVTEGDVYVSADEGKTWRLAPDVPRGDALVVVEHPHNPRCAYIMSRNKRHYRTLNHGESWQHFDMPAPPAYVMNPLSFHAAKPDAVLYLGTVCDRKGWAAECQDNIYYTADNFATSKEILQDVSRCQFGHTTKDFKHDAHPDLIFCVAFAERAHSLDSSRLYASTDFFASKSIVDFGVGERAARGVVAIGIVTKFMTAALKMPTGEMELFVTLDTKQWARAQFPHASSSALRENGYTIVDSTLHSLAIDVLLSARAALGTLFVSNADGTFFVEALADTNRNELGYVDFESVVGLEGVGLANVVRNARDVEAGRARAKEVRSVATFDDGSSWDALLPPKLDHHGKPIGCDVANSTACALHLYSVTTPHNFGRVFSSPAPGFVFGVGSVGEFLKPYGDCDTFLSTDAGLTWSMVHHNAHKYEFGDAGSVMLVVDDEEVTDIVRYSLDAGATWEKLTLPVKLRAKVLTSVPDATAQSFLLIGTLGRDQDTSKGRQAAVHIDFAGMRKRKCTDADFESWQARGKKGECVMGRKQSYRRRKPKADCYVGDKFAEPEPHNEPCPCTEADYECDFNFVRADGMCVPVGPEAIPPGSCPAGGPDNAKFLGSSGYRLIPGNSCKKENGEVLDEKVEKPCSGGQKPKGEVSHQTHHFTDQLRQYAYFKDSQVILVRLADLSVWQSSNEGFTWNQLHPDEKFVAFYHHPYSASRAYLVTGGMRMFTTTDTGRSWNPVDLPLPPNPLGIPVLGFSPSNSDWVLWTGGAKCESASTCYAAAYYSTTNGRISWTLVDNYVRTCAWARGPELRIDTQMILCESYRDKRGAQATFDYSNPLEFWAGRNFYKEKTKVFDRVVGFAKFSEYLIVAELPMQQDGLNLQVSLDGRTFATGRFPPSMQLQPSHAYTILESSTDSVFLHLTMSGVPDAEYGSILKSNSNGTYFSVSIDNVNRDHGGYVDFEKVIGLDGIALINVVANPADAPHTKHKDIQSRITHNDGGTWKPLVPPVVDSLGQKYPCDSTKCALHVHGFTERYDVRATYSSPSVVGLLMAVGNVGEKLAEYKDSNTFFSRDAGFHWEEVRKDAHLWEFGDSGSVLVMVNDEKETDQVLYSLNEGQTWTPYMFLGAGEEKLRVRSIVTVPTDTSRKFILFGQADRGTAVAVHLDFSQLTTRKCELSVVDSAEDDFELWSPAEERDEKCLFGRQVLYHRRVRDRECYVGDQKKYEEKFVKNCVCKPVDFECEFNHVRNPADGTCVLAEGATPMPDDDSCPRDAEYWYERTAYRKIKHSTCEGGDRPDQGPRHACPGPRTKGVGFWIFMVFLTLAFAGLAAMWFHRRGARSTGAIRLPEARGFDDAGPLATLASVPWFLLGLVGAAWNYVGSTRMPDLGIGRRNLSARGYRSVPVDEDAQVLRFEDDE